MIKVNKLEPQQYYIEHIKDKALYKEIDADVKNRIKLDMLGREQNHVCCYCEIEIKNIEDSHIDHVIPQSMLNQGVKLPSGKADPGGLDYKNFLVSCNHKDTCGCKKQNAYPEKFINPTIDDPKKYMAYNLFSGELKPIGDETKISFEQTEKTLNLNNKRLITYRKNFIAQLYTYLSQPDAFIMFAKQYKEQPTLIQQFIEEML